MNTRPTRRHRLLLLVLLAGSLLWTFSATRPTLAAEGREPVTMAPVIVTAPRIAAPLESVPAAVTVIGEEEIRRGQPMVTINESLVRVPGVFVQNDDNFAQGARIAIRGFGARSAFGIRGIQVYVDGIPQTLPDGQTQPDTIDPSAIERIEVMRGPVAALYGNSSGGVINIVTKEAPGKPSAEANTLFGSHGLRKTVLQGGGRTPGASAFVTLSRLETDGYREHGEAETWRLNSKVRAHPDEASSLTVLLNGLRSPTLRDPGGLTREQVETDPRQASQLALRFDTREEISDGRTGLVYRRTLSDRSGLEAAGWYGRRGLDNSTPFRFVELDREVFGGRVQYDTTREMLGLEQQWFAGVDVQRQQDDRVNFENLGGHPGGALLLSQEEEVTGLGLYLQDHIRLAGPWSMVAGARYDRVKFKINDRFRSDGNDTGSKAFDQVTGRAGLNHYPAPELQVYANLAQSFETPTTTELVNRPEGGGGINPELSPQKALNHEVGLKGTFGRRAAYEASLFYIRLKDELIAFRDLTDRVFYRNAGESRRIGTELDLAVEIAKGLKANLAYAFMHSEFEEYEKAGRNLAGNAVPGLPRHRFFGELLYEHPSGFFAGIDLLKVGRFFADDENTAVNRGYTTVHLRTGFRRSVGRWAVSPYLGVRNLLDESYIGNVRINANGGRYFEPAPERNIYGGVAVRYEW